MVKAIARLKRHMKEIKGLQPRSCEVTSPEERREAELTIIKMVQEATFAKEIQCLLRNKETQVKDNVNKAAHTEMLDDLTTDAFINALRSFIAIRGTVRQIRCDQGTNFIGARCEFAEALREMDQVELKELG
ncbi:hypothetical protein AOLI_G00136980 [Acnodon oligacanthus]